MKVSVLVRAMLAGLIASSLTLTPARTAAGSSPAQVALNWNSNAVSAVRAARTTDGVPPGSPARALYQTEGLLYMSYVQAAVYDATMKISHRYQLYHHFEAAAGHASLEAAVIAASYNTLVFYLGDPDGSLASKYTAAIAALAPGGETERGIALGRAAAADIETLRAGDGRNAQVSDTCPIATVPPTPGMYLCTPPPSVQALQTPWLASMRPFLLSSASAFRAPAPPALDSAPYGADFDEVRAYGSANSTVRTPDQQATAWFWNANTINQLNQTLRDAAIQHNLDLVDTVRLLAMGELVPTDAGIACFDSKYHYLRWRPMTAIRADGDPTDATWSPLVATPNHPEYPSQHGCITAALAEVLATAFGTGNLDVAIPGAQNGATTLTTSRTYHSVGDLESELVNARVWIGFHFRTSVTVGEDLGTALAGQALAHNFLPSDDRIGD
jgi:hypothetical protein